MANGSSDDGLGWLVAFGLGCYIAYTQWWKTPEPPKTPVPNAAQLVASYPLGPLVTLENGTVWNMVWTSLKGPPTARLAWVRQDHSENKTRDERETMTLYKINCTTSGFVTLSIIDYDKDGNVIDDWGQFTKEESFAVPSSNLDSVVSAACLPQFDKLPRT
jgi:hypothetical protein